MRPPLFFSAFGSREVLLLLLHGAPRDAHILRVHISCACTARTRMPHPRVCAASHPLRPPLLLCPFGSREVLLLLLHGAHARCAYPARAHILRVHSSDAHAVILITCARAPCCDLRRHTRARARHTRARAQYTHVHTTALLTDGYSTSVVSTDTASTDRAHFNLRAARSGCL